MPTEYTTSHPHGISSEDKAERFDELQAIADSAITTMDLGAKVAAYFALELPSDD